MHRRSAPPRSCRRPATLGIALLAALIALIATPTAQAGPLVDSADGCTAAPLEQPFLPWLDAMDYVLLPGGTFERKTVGWSPEGASVVPGNEPYYVHAADEADSLSIPSGASATSATMCVGLEEPTLRLFVRSGAPSLLSKLRVEVLFEDALGRMQAATIGSVSALTSTSWTPSVPMAIGVNLLPLIGDKTPVRFRFSAEGSAGWRIDDVYVDPRYR